MRKRSTIDLQTSNFSVSPVYQQYRPGESGPQRVVGYVLLDGLAHLRRGPEEAVGRHESTDALMRASEIVRLHEELEPPLAVGEVGEHRAREKFLPQRLPEALHLAERLRMLRTALDVADPFTTQLALEVRLAAPRRVLTALVGENFARVAVRRDAAPESLHHELGALVVRERVRDDEARVVVHEGREVETLVTTQQKREDVRLPELVRLRPLEASGRMLARP